MGLSIGAKVLLLLASAKADNGEALNALRSVSRDNFLSIMCPVFRLDFIVNIVLHII